MLRHVHELRDSMRFSAYRDVGYFKGSFPSCTFPSWAFLCHWLYVLIYINGIIPESLRQKSLDTAKWSFSCSLKFGLQVFYQEILHVYLWGRFVYSSLFHFLTHISYQSNFGFIKRFIYIIYFFIFTDNFEKFWCDVSSSNVWSNSALNWSGCELVQVVTFWNYLFHLFFFCYRYV